MSKQNQQKFLPICPYLLEPNEPIAELLVHFDIPLQNFSRPVLPQELTTETGHDEYATLVARIDPASGVAEGDRIRLCLEPHKIHLFDTASGERVGGHGSKE